MDGTSEGDVGVGSKAGEAAVGELGNSGGAAAAAATEAAAMAGEAAGERAEETRRSIENATRDGNQKSYGSSNRRNKKSIPTAILLPTARRANVGFFPSGRCASTQKHVVARFHPKAIITGAAVSFTLSRSLSHSS
jgi:hypothetical protein